jgi:hypothetical protein
MEDQQALDRAIKSDMLLSSSSPTPDEKPDTPPSSSLVTGASLGDSRLARWEEERKMEDQQALDRAIKKSTMLFEKRRSESYSRLLRLRQTRSQIRHPHRHSSPEHR